METNKKFYVICEKNTASITLDGIVKIATEPARTNSSNEICTDGWCGTTNDVSVIAFGQHDSQEEAQAFIDQYFNGDLRYTDWDENDDDIVVVYKLGKYEPMGKEATGNFIYDSLVESVTSDTNDYELNDMVNEWEREARRNLGTLTGAYDLAVEYRDGLLSE